MQGRGIYKKTTSSLTGVLEKINKQLLEFKSMQDYSIFRPFQGQRAFPSAILDKHSFIGSKNDITSNLCKFIDASQKEIIIQNPYVVLTGDARAALKRASDRGIPIILHTNSPVSTDSLLTQAFFVKDWKEVMAAMPTLKIYVFTGERKLHAKVFVFDGVISVVGTYNMDYVSEQINSEVISLIKSKTFAKRLSLRIAEDIKVSAEYKVEVQKNGKIKVIYGPSFHSPKKIMEKLKRLARYKLLKYLI
jgi:phosphatidylserine/phosphatidylglycerophosphate/cardiolipin synthase-like enzyme